jgi:hypothetical protein
MKRNPSSRRPAASLLFLSIVILLLALAGEAASKSKTLYAFKHSPPEIIPWLASSLTRQEISIAQLPTAASVVRTATAWFSS